MEFKEVKIPEGDLIQSEGGELTVGDHPIIGVLRGMQLKKLPSVAETIDWGRTVLALGMVSFYLIVFHGTAFRKAYRSSAEWSRSVSKPARGFLNPSFYHPSAAPQKAPDAPTSSL